MTHRALFALTVTLTLVSLCLGLARFLTTDPGSVGMFAGVGFMAFVCVVVKYMERKKPIATYRRDERFFYVGAILSAGGLIVGAMALKILISVDLVNGDITQRVWGIAGGILLAMVGDLTPKVLGPLAKTPQSRRRAQTTRRYVGGSFFMAGLAAAAAWAFLPTALAKSIAFAFCLSAILFVMTLCAVNFLTREKTKAI